MAKHGGWSGLHSVSCPKFNKESKATAKQTRHYPGSLTIQMIPFTQSPSSCCLCSRFKQSTASELASESQKWNPGNPREVPLPFWGGRWPLPLVELGWGPTWAVSVNPFLPGKHTKNVVEGTGKWYTQMQEWVEQTNKNIYFASKGSPCTEIYAKWPNPNWVTICLLKELYKYDLILGDILVPTVPITNHGHKTVQC